MAPQTEFPPELLSQPPAARLAYFRDKVVAHPHLKETHQQLWQAIQQPGGASLIFVFGPTGVGKTTLRCRLEQQLWEAGQPAIEQDPGHVPVVGLEVAVADADSFRWRDYYQRALVALDEPMLDHKILPDHIPHQRMELKDSGRYKVTSELRWALEQALHHRRPTAFIVDEAQHFKRIASGRRLLDQMDTLKSLANLTGTTHVLIGTYELLGFSQLSAQLDRRSCEIHFPRYHIDIPEEMLAFKRILLTFQRHLPLTGEPDLVAHAEYFYERSVGCVGVLKDWLTRALAAALEDGQETLTQTVLERQTLPTRKLLRMAREIREGEETLTANGRAQTELRSLLGMSIESVEQQNTGSPRKVGKRKPVRDLVGHHEQAA
ncbi:MAG TPA: ATP-binding protein [Anaerolineales bacterium]|nr:ATP-binding protein [Anaerolineales bacterium]